MIDLIQQISFNVLALIVTLGILVTIHEFGHFWVARRCGVKVERFSIGYGKPLFRWTRGETEYVIAPLPLGGYVRMLGEQDKSFKPEDEGRAFSSKSLGQRSAILAAGPLANFLLAVFLFWIMFMVGVSDWAPVLGRVDQGTAAHTAGLQSGDEVLSVDGKPVETWQDVRMALVNRLGESGTLNLEVRRDNSDIHQAHIPLNSFLSDERDPNPAGELGLRLFEPDIPARLAEVTPGERAEGAGLKPGDEILRVNGMPIEGWFHLYDLIEVNPETDMSLNVRREGSLLDLTVTPYRNENSVGKIGARVEVPDVLPSRPASMQKEIYFSPFAAVPKAFEETWSTTGMIADSLKKMISGLISVKNLSGPITIATVAGDTVKSGAEYFLWFLAMLSVTLGVMNLLPIPVLDGGHLLYNLVEFVIRKPVPEKFQQWGMQFGLLLIVGFTFIAFYNDFNRIL